jgi:arginase family enzyme
MDKNQRKIWYEAVERPDFHFAGDPEAGFAQIRIYGDTPSFLGVPVAWEADELEGADVVFVGLPWEGGIQTGPATFANLGARPIDPEAILERGSAYMAPEYLRKWSEHYSLSFSGGFFPEVGSDFKVLDYLNIMDYRDVEVKEWDVERTFVRAYDTMSDIVKVGAIPLVIGGDHSIPYPVMKAITDHHGGKMGIILFDSHYDNNIGGRSNAGNAFGRYLENSDSDPKNWVIIGVQGGSYNTAPMQELCDQLGITVFSRGDVESMGMMEVIQQAVGIASEGTDRVYVSLDADSMDPVTFPAQKYPEPFGLEARDVKDALELVSRETNLAGFDIVCIGPIYDHNGVGALTACKLYLEVLKGLAIRKRSELEG